MKVRQPLLDLSAPRPLVTDQPLKFDVTFGGSRLRGQTVPTGAFVGVLQRCRRVGQLPLEGAPHRRGFA